MPFGNMNVNLPQINIPFRYTSIEIVDLHKSLGIHIDRNHIFKKHIDVHLRSIYSNYAYLPVPIKYVLALMMLQILCGLEVVSGTTTYVFARLNRILNCIRYVQCSQKRSYLGIC